MERKLYRELWKIRFNKMLALEKQGVTVYQKLLSECRNKYRGHSVEAPLERLIADEKRHVILVGRLLRILEAQPD